MLVWTREEMIFGAQKSNTSAEGRVERRKEDGERTEWHVRGGAATVMSFLDCDGDMRILILKSMSYCNGGIRMIVLGLHEQYYDSIHRMGKLFALYRSWWSRPVPDLDAGGSLIEFERIRPSP